MKLEKFLKQERETTVCKNHKAEMSRTQQEVRSL